MDVKTAYLNADIDCTVYVEQPEGYCKTDTNGNKLVCRLNKSSYGLKQSGRNWNTLLHSCLISEKFEQSLADPCVYVKFTDNVKLIVIIFLDDLIIAGSDVGVVHVRGVLSNRFQMKDLGRLNWFLGIRFVFDGQCIRMNQHQYVTKMLAKFNMSDCKPKSIPCDLGFDKEICSDSKELADSKLYREIVGSLIYIMSCTRPDLCYVVTKLSQHMSSPTEAHLNLAKHVLRYLKYTSEFELKYS
jgi:hypothetical protein